MKILNNQIFRYILVLIIGCGIGAIFYPSKTITKEERVKYEQIIERLKEEKKVETSNLWSLLNREQKEFKQYREESSRKTDILKEENFKLKQKVSEKKFKIVRPDGTIEEKWFRDSETDVVSSTVTRIRDEFNRKVHSIEEKWKKIHEQRIKKVKEEYESRLVESSKTKLESHKKEKVEINKRNFGISLGLTGRDLNYFSSISYDVYGPFFLDIHLETSREFQDSEAGVGVGFRF